jgi:hypothetical protein
MTMAQRFDPPINMTIGVPKELFESVRKKAERDHSLDGHIARMLKTQVLDKIENQPRSTRRQSRPKL